MTTVVYQAILKLISAPVLRRQCSRNYFRYNNIYSRKSILIVNVSTGAIL